MGIIFLFIAFDTIAQEKFVKPAFRMSTQQWRQGVLQYSDLINNLDRFNDNNGFDLIYCRWKPRLQLAEPLVETGIIDYLPAADDIFKDQYQDQDEIIDSYEFVHNGFNFRIKTYKREFCDENGKAQNYYSRSSCDTIYAGYYELSLGINGPTCETAEESHKLVEKNIIQFDPVVFVDPQTDPSLNTCSFPKKFESKLKRFKRKSENFFHGNLKSDFEEYENGIEDNLDAILYKYINDSVTQNDFKNGKLKKIARRCAEREFEIAKSNVLALKSEYLRHQYCYAKRDFLCRKLVHFKIDPEVYLNEINDIERLDIIDSLRLYYDFDNTKVQSGQVIGEFYLGYPDWSNEFLPDYLVTTLAERSGISNYASLSYVELPTDFKSEVFVFVVTDKSNRRAYYSQKCQLSSSGSWQNSIVEIPFHRAVSQKRQVQRFGDHLVFTYPDSVFVCLLNSNPAKILAFPANVDCANGYWLIASNTLVGDQFRDVFIYPSEKIVTQHLPQDELDKLKAVLALQEELHKHNDEVIYSSSPLRSGLNQFYPNYDQSKILYQRKMRVADLNNDGIDELYGYNISNGEIRDVSCYSMIGNDLVKVNDDQARQWLFSEFECHNLLSYSKLILKE